MRPTRRVLATLVPAALTLLGPARHALAATVNVTTAAELTAAIAAAKAGDEIVLAAGTYALTSNVTCGAAGTATAPIVVRASAPLAAKVEISSVEGFVVTGAHWHFEGLDVRGVCAQDSACEHAFHVQGAAEGFVLRGARVADFNAQLKVNASAGGAQIPHRGLVEGCELFDSRARSTQTPVTKLNIDTGDDWVVRANYIHDFHRANGTPSYGAFMKSGGKNGLFERNLVLCTKDDNTAGTHIGLSFGGGGTAPEFCAPAFSAAVPCDVEHDGGTMRNNVIANCSDVGIYINRGKGSALLHNTLIGTSGVDYRFATSSGQARGNVIEGTLRNRDGATHTAADNLVGVTSQTLAAMYFAPLAGDLRKKGDLSAVLGKGPPLAEVTDDYCARARVGTWDLGAIQHSLGDCPDVRPPLGPPGTGGADAGPGGAGADGGVGGAGSSGGAGPSSGAPGSDPPADGGCGCPAAPTRDAWTFGAIGILATALLTARRRRRR